MVRHLLGPPRSLVVVQFTGYEGVGDAADVRRRAVPDVEPLMGSPHRGPLGRGGDNRRGGSMTRRSPRRRQVVRGSSQRGPFSTALVTNRKAQGLAGSGGERIHGSRRI